MRGIGHRSALLRRRRQDAFVERTGEGIAIIITRTPYRISFFGGGSDYAAWYREHGGIVLTTTIDQYCHVLLRPQPAYMGTKYRIIRGEIEDVDRFDDIRHAGVRGCLGYLKEERGVEVNHSGDLPARSGLGSSSAFTVGMLHALHTMRRRYATKVQLAAEAIAVEQDVLKETVGVQDQIECAHGGLNLIEIRRDGGYDVRPVILPAGRMRALEARLVLVYTGLQRHASEIADAQLSNVERKEPELKQIMALVPKAVAALVEDDLDEFGRLLHETWLLKRTLSDKIATVQVDEIYAKARNAGASGGKLLGAGGGGFMVFYVPTQQARFDVRHALSQLCYDVRFEHRGSQVIHA